MQAEQTSLLTAALDNLARYALTGCRQAANRAADLLERLSETQALDSDTRQIYLRLSETLDGQGEPARFQGVGS